MKQVEEIKQKLEGKRNIRDLDVIAAEYGIGVWGVIGMLASRPHGYRIAIHYADEAV